MAHQTVALYSRIQAARSMRALREERGYTQADVARVLECSERKVIRLEAGENSISAGDLQALVAFYGVAADKAAKLADLARTGRGTDWFQEYDDVLDGLSMRLFTFDAVAEEVREAQPRFVPGTLQTAGYAKAVLNRHFSGDQLARAVQVRLLRQQVIAEAGGSPQHTAVLDESVVRRVVGSPDVMKSQLQRLADAAGSGVCVIRVVPFTAGTHPALDGSFLFLEARDEVNAVTDSILVAETLGKDYRRESHPEVLAEYEEKWARTLGLALSVEDSLKLISEQIAFLEAL